MDFLVTGAHAGANQFTRLLKRRFGWLIPPGIGPEMIAAQCQQLLRNSGGTRGGSNLGSELLGSLSRVTAVLIYLARSGFDEQERAISDSLFETSLNDGGVG